VIKKDYPFFSQAEESVIEKEPEESARLKSDGPF
jgi:hypothetical protein